MIFSANVIIETVFFTIKLLDYKLISISNTLNL